MENNENENNENGQQPQLDPAGEVKQKIFFFLAAIIFLVVIKFALGL